jgi:hypothetical protein
LIPSVLKQVGCDIPETSTSHCVSPISSNLQKAPLWIKYFAVRILLLRSRTSAPSFLDAYSVVYPLRRRIFKRWLRAVSKAACCMGKIAFCLAIGGLSRGRRRPLPVDASNVPSVSKGLLSGLVPAAVAQKRGRGRVFAGRPRRKRNGGPLSAMSGGLPHSQRRPNTCLRPSRDAASIVPKRYAPAGA